MNYHKSKILFPLFNKLSMVLKPIKEPVKIHGISYLENRYSQLEVNTSNSNDVLKILGNPHSKSIENDLRWFYIERSIVKGKYYKLGKNVLKENNIIVLEFNQLGILTFKDILTKEEMNNVSYAKDKTKNPIDRTSFVNDFLQSLKKKMYGNR